MTFKAAALADLPTFLNVSEFADTVDIDGVPLRCVLDETETTHSAEGVTLRESTLRVRVSDLAMPVVDQRMEIGEALANVVNVDEEQGMWVIRLRWFDS